MSRMDFQRLEKLSRKAARCRYCFERFGLESPITDVAQARWVGPDYRNARTPWTDPGAMVQRISVEGR